MRLQRRIKRDRVGARQRGAVGQAPRSLDSVISQEARESYDLTGELSDKMIFARVARHHVQHVPGVARVSGSFVQKMRGAPGVSVRLTSDGALRIRVSLEAFFGYDLASLGRCAQDAVRAGMQRLSERPVALVDVRIAGIRGGDAGDIQFLTRQGRLFSNREQVKEQQ
jgi:uncharacterized alkaline shock family protein YloU